MSSTLPAQVDPRQNLLPLGTVHAREVLDCLLSSKVGRLGLLRLLGMDPIDPWPCADSTQPHHLVERRMCLALEVALMSVEALEELDGLELR